MVSFYIRLNTKTQNSSKILLKVPTNLNVKVAVLRCYSAYLWVKKFNRFGVISSADIPKQHRNRFNYWIKKLVSAGWVEAGPGHYRIKSYQAVWRLMGIERSITKAGHSKIKYWSLSIDSDKNFLKQVKDGVFKHLARRHKTQVAYRLVNGRTSRINNVRRNHVKLSGEGAAKLFGYAYWSSGLKYRNMYFDVIKGDRYTYLGHSGVLLARYECGIISLSV